MEVTESEFVCFLCFYSSHKISGPAIRHSGSSHNSESFERVNASILDCFHLNVPTTFPRVDFHPPMTLESDSSDAEPGYVHSVAPDPRRLEPLDNPVRPLFDSSYLYRFDKTLAYRGTGMFCGH